MEFHKEMNDNNLRTNILIGYEWQYIIQLSLNVVYAKKMARANVSHCMRPNKYNTELNFINESGREIKIIKYMAHNMCSCQVRK